MISGGSLGMCVAEVLIQLSDKNRPASAVWVAIVIEYTAEAGVWFDKSNEIISPEHQIQIPSPASLPS